MHRNELLTTLLLAFFFGAMVGKARVLLRVAVEVEFGVRGQKIF